MSTILFRPHSVNPLTTGNTLRQNQVSVSIVAVDALVLKHQAISSHIADQIPFFVQHDYAQN